MLGSGVLGYVGVGLGVLELVLGLVWGGLGLVRGGLVWVWSVIVSGGTTFRHAALLVGRPAVGVGNIYGACCGVFQRGTVVEWVAGRAAEQEVGGSIPGWGRWRLGWGRVGGLQCA